MVQDEGQIDETQDFDRILPTCLVSAMQRVDGIKARRGEERV